MLRWSIEEYQSYLGKQKECSQFSKYHSKKVWVDGLCFDSKKEADYYVYLKYSLMAREIKGFSRQARFVIIEGTDKDNRATEYIADFVVFHNDGSSEIIDTKGVKTQAFKLKMKAFRAMYPELEVKII